MNIFEEVKARLSAKKVAEYYGLKMNRNGMACCPFHDDKHPSMKIDENHFYCFGCGEHGDAIAFVAKSFGLSQYAAALKINEDFCLGIEVGRKIPLEEQQKAQKQMAEARKIKSIKTRFLQWKRETTDVLLECEELIEKSQQTLMGEDSHVVFLTNGFAYMMHMKPIIEYWLDILCAGTDEEAKEFFLADGKEVDRINANIKRIADDILGKNRKCAG